MAQGQNAMQPARDKTCDLVETLRLLDPASLEVAQTVGDGLVLSSPELGEICGISVAPCFPVTQPGRFLVFCDRDGQEVGILEDIEEVGEEFQRVLADELAKQHFLPIITAVDAIYREFQIPIWQVQTDRGPRQLELKSRHDAHRLGGGRLYIRDAEGNGYLIPDTKRLDRVSQDLIEFNV